QAEPFAINDSDVVVGELTPASGTGTHAFLYDGTLHDLGGLPGKLITQALAINNIQWVVGTSGTSDIFPVEANTNGRAFLYADGQMHDLNSLVVGPSNLLLLAAAGVNDSGQIVGWGKTPDGPIHGF